MQISTSSLSRTAAVLAVSLLAAACGSSSSSSMAPSSVPDAASATLQGTINAGGAGPSSLGASSASTSAAGLRVSAQGSGQSATTDGQGRFTLSGLPAGAVTLRIEGPGVDARLTLGGLLPGQVLTVGIQVSGSQASVISDSGPSPSPSPSPSPRPSPSPSPNPGGEIEFSGTVQSVGQGSLQVGGRTVLVQAGTEIKRGQDHIGLAQVQVGETAKVEGQAQADGSVLAREIKLGATSGGGGDDDGDDDNGGDDDDDDDDDNGGGNDDGGGDDNGGGNSGSGSGH